MNNTTVLLENIPTTVKLCAARTVVGGGVLLVGQVDKKTYSVKVEVGEGIVLGSTWRYVKNKGLVPWDTVIEPPKPKTKILPLGNIIPFRRTKRN